AEDGIRDATVTGVQTCALPISVTVLFAGSIEHVMRDLFGPAERALSQFGSFYELPTIAAEDWAIGIPARLKLDRCAIDEDALERDRKSTRLNSSHGSISYAVFC